MVNEINDEINKEEIYDKNLVTDTNPNFSAEKQRDQLAHVIDQLTIITEINSKEIESRGRDSFHTLRKDWSKIIINWITYLITFNIILTIGVGSGAFDFLKYKWFIISITLETFLQIVGLGIIAVNFLFSEKR